MRVHLDRCYIYLGKFYGPGEEDVPNGMAADLGLNQLSVTIKVDDTEFQAAATKVKTKLEGLVEYFQEKVQPASVMPIDGPEPIPVYFSVPRLPADTPNWDLLMAEDLTTAQQVLDHPDLTQIKGIGKAKAAKILAYLKED